MPIPLAMPFPLQVKQLLNHFLDSLGSIRLLSCSSIQDILLLAGNGKSKLPLLVSGY